MGYDTHRGAQGHRTLVENLEKSATNLSNHAIAHTNYANRAVESSSTNKSKKKKKNKGKGKADD